MVAHDRTRLIGGLPSLAGRPRGKSQPWRYATSKGIDAIRDGDGGRYFDGDGRNAPWGEGGRGLSPVISIILRDLL